MNFCNSFTEITLFNKLRFFYFYTVKGYFTDQSNQVFYQFYWAV